MNRRKKRKEKGGAFPFPLETNRKPPARWRVVWIHPKGRYKIVEYRVRTPLGDLSAPMRECFWTLPYGKTLLTEKEHIGYITKAQLERIANESE